MTMREPAADQAAVAAPRSGRGFLVLRVLGGATIVALFSLAVLSGVVLALDGSLTRVEVDGLGDQTTLEPPDPQSSDDTTASGDPSADPDPDPANEPRSSDVEPVTVLLLASDSREVLTEAEREELGTGMAYGERTEVVALARLDAQADRLRTVHVPRDTVLPLCDGSEGRVNAAYGVGESSGVGGISCVVETLTEWSGVQIDHAVMADFRGFVDIVDAIGGVELYLEEALYDQRANLDLQAGCQVLDGADALAFARARGLDDDFGRISRQQRLLTELRDQLSEDGVLGDPVSSLRLAEAVASSLQIDDSLTLNRIRQLVTDHRRTVQRPLDMRTVPGTPDTSGEAWLLRPDEEAAEALFTWLLEGDPAAPESGSDTGDASGGEADEDGGATQDGSTPPEDDPSPPPVGSEPQRCD
ncbi:MAG: LCP family protein [Nitriliruptoraceae bacterium]